MGAMWFAPSLLIVSVVYVVMRKICGSQGLKTVWGVILCTFIGFLCIKLHVKNPLCIWNAMTVLIIYHLGAVFKKYQLLPRYVNSGVTLACIILSVAFYMLGGIVRLQPSAMSSNNPLFFYCSRHGCSYGVWSVEVDWSDANCRRYSTLWGTLV